ncbi:MAG: GIY-YIG nuclease family protein [Candidatus Babeliales bacterium]
MNGFIVYILKCFDDSYYVGHTDNIDVRMSQHQQGFFSGYTATRLPVVLIFAENCNTRDEAFILERQIKGWSRKKKEALIHGDFKLLSKYANTNY